MRKLIEAAVDELADSPYSELTVRSVAARAAVSPTTAYTYFPSKDALIAEIYLRLLRDAPVHVDVNESAETRVKAQLRDLLLLVADTPHLADACTTALMADDAAVSVIRARIAGEVGRRITSSLGPGYGPEVAQMLHLLFTGATVHARSIPGGYPEVAEQLDAAVAHTLTCAAHTRIEST